MSFHSNGEPLPVKIHCHISLDVTSGYEVVSFSANNLKQNIFLELIKKGPKENRCAVIVNFCYYKYRITLIAVGSLEIKLLLQGVNESGEHAFRR